MTNTIEKLHAVTADKPAGTLRYMPDNLNAGAILGVLRTIGLTIPVKLEAAAKGGEPLRTSEHRYTVKEIDDALSAQVLSISDRLRFKAALDRNGILQR